MSFSTKHTKTHCYFIIKGILKKQGNSFFFSYDIFFKVGLCDGIFEIMEERNKWEKDD